MAVNTYFKGEEDTLFVDGVDVKRAAKRLLQDITSPEFQHPTDVGQAMDWLLKSLGLDSHHAARAQAKVTCTHGVGAQNEAPMNLARRLAQIKSQNMPKGVGDTLGLLWPKQSKALFERALLLRDGKKTQAIAIVGGPGKGKTVLARDAVARKGGLIMDVSLYPSLPDGSRLSAGNLIVLDRPAQIPSAPVDRKHEGQELMRLMSDNTQEGRQAYQKFVVATSIRNNLGRDHGFGGLQSRTLEHVQKWPDIPLVFVKPDIDSVKSVLHSVFYPGLGERHARYIWDAIQVVDLDKMSVYEVQAGAFAAAATD